MKDISANRKSFDNPPPPFLIRLVATGFFSGYSPVAPGTAGSAAGLILYAIPGFESPLVMFIFILTFFLVGTYASRRMELYAGDDPACVVIDEIVGMWVTLFFLPKTISLAVAGFFIFRFFDIIKPEPASYVERYRHGTGVMLDDVVAGIYSNLLLQIIILLFPGLKAI